MIRSVWSLACLLLVATAQAQLPVTYQDAMSAYEAGRADVARASFRRLAENGFPNAQFKLGAMLVEGEGGSKDPVEGALWIRLAAAEGHEPAIESSPDALDAMAPEQREAVADRSPDWQARYSKAALLQRHAPVLCEDDCLNSDSEGLRRAGGAAEVIFNGRRAVVEQHEPIYPRELRRRGIPGYVQMGAWVGADGEFEHPHVIFSDPEWIFDGPALAALEKWRVEWVNGPPDPGNRYVSQTIVFYIEGRSWGRKARRQYERLIDRWDDDLAAAYRAARMAYTLEFGDLIGGREGLVAKTHDAARAGLPRAQIDLHETLKMANGVRQDDRAAAFWLQRAAFSGNARAQFLLSLRDDFSPDFKQSLLYSAAEKGSVPAIMTVLRQQLASPETADRARLSSLVELLPEFWYMVNPDQTLVDQAKQLISG